MNTNKVNEHIFLMKSEKINKKIQMNKLIFQ